MKITVIMAEVSSQNSVRLSEHLSYAFLYADATLEPPEGARADQELVSVLKAITNEEGQF